MVIDFNGTYKRTNNEITKRGNDLRFEVLSSLEQTKELVTVCHTRIVNNQLIYDLFIYGGGDKSEDGRTGRLDKHKGPVTCEEVWRHGNMYQGRRSSRARDVNLNLSRISRKFWVELRWRRSLETRKEPKECCGRSVQMTP